MFSSDSPLAWRAERSVVCVNRAVRVDSDAEKLKSVMVSLHCWSRTDKAPAAEIRSPTKAKSGVSAGPAQIAKTTIVPDH